VRRITGAERLLDLGVYYDNIQNMADLGRVTGFDWDAGNERKSVDKHQVSQAEAEQLFLHEPLLIIEDMAHSQTEARYHALGQTATGRLFHATFTLRAEATKIRVISVRDMSRRERRGYEQAS